jgi:RNA polymerase sigma factor (sigma-70 family)
VRKRWSLSQQAFDALLARLDPDREIAGAIFQSLRQKLLQYFSYEACAFPDRWADETLDRVAKRLSDGSPIEEINAFARGVARMVLREARLIETREWNVRTLPPPDQGNQIETERMACCLDECMAALSDDSRKLIERYYLSNSQSQQLARQELAQQLGISKEALRNRMLRIRRQLETCLNECKGKKDRPRY